MLTLSFSAWGEAGSLHMGWWQTQQLLFKEIGFKRRLGRDCWEGARLRYGKAQCGWLVVNGQVMNENSADPDYFQGRLWTTNIRFIKISKYPNLIDKKSVAKLFVFNVTTKAKCYKTSMIFSFSKSFLIMICMPRAPCVCVWSILYSDHHHSEWTKKRKSLMKQTWPVTDS